MDLIFVIGGVAGIIFTILLFINKHVCQFNKPAVVVEQQSVDT